MIELSAQPIPGMSLTSEPGNRPWEQPPQFVELDDVVGYYVERLTEQKTVDNLLKAMQQDAPLVDIANTLIKAGMMKGIHSIDVGFLVVPILVELMQTIGDMNNVGYVVESEDYMSATEVDEETAREVLASAVEEVKAAPAVKRTGLMAKE
jgi:hypothetical protein